MEAWISHSKIWLYAGITEETRRTDEKYRLLLFEALNDVEACRLMGKALICRQIGECFEAIGNLSKTIEYWEEAVALNPNVGIKQKLNHYKHQA